MRTQNVPLCPDLRPTTYRPAINDIAEGERFIHSLVAQSDLDALDEAPAVLDADDPRLIVRRLIIDIGPVNRWT